MQPLVPIHLSNLSQPWPGPPAGALSPDDPHAPQRPGHTALPPQAVLLRGMAPVPNGQETDSKNILYYHNHLSSHYQNPKPTE